MTLQKSEIINTALEKKLKIAFVTAGGGAALFDLFKIEGCSRVMTEGRMLYSQESFNTFLGQTLNIPYVSSETASLLAQRLDLKSEADICLALTCALITDRERRGDNHGFLALSNSEKIVFQNHIKISGDTRILQDKYIADTALTGLLDFITNS